MSAVLGQIYALATEALAGPGGPEETAVLVNLCTILEAAAIGQQPPAAVAVTTTRSASPLEQLHALLRRQEWVRMHLPGHHAGLRCPVCLNLRSRTHKAECWLRQALLLLQLVSKEPLT